MPGKRGRAKTVRVKKAKGKAGKASKGKGRRGKLKAVKAPKTTRAITTPTSAASSGVVRNTLAATRKRVSTSRFRITSRNPLD